ncbi:MAG: GntR family transcriptional regulator [Propioniciclava sp.]
MTIQAGRIRQIALGDQVADALRRLIISGEVAPGTRLVEVALAEQFGVSRGPIREAFAKLEAEGLLTTGRRGAFVVGVSMGDIDELYSLREAIEQLAVAMIVESRDGADWSALEAAVATMAAAAENDDHQRFTRADIEFHVAVYELAGHRRLLDVWRSYQQTFAVVLDQSARRGLDLQNGAADHQQLLETFKTGTEAACREAVHLHLTRAHERLKGAFAP